MKFSPAKALSQVLLTKIKYERLQSFNYICLILNF